MSRRISWAPSGMAVLFFLTLVGCGDDSPSTRLATPAAPRALPSAMAPHLLDTPTPDSTPDALETADPLLQDTGTASAAPSDAAPLTPIGAVATTTPTPQYDDPLAATPDTLAESAPGQKMPTAHSHWLKGGIFNARVTVRLNGLFLGTFTAPQDKDITMKLRPGMNTITFEYHPLTSTASAHLDVLESEHDPPIPPLATFRSSLLDTEQSPLQTTTATLTFLAH